MSYKVQFLNDEEFDSLPAKNIESKIGVAYPAAGEAFVRRSGSNVMDVFTAMHELEHLEGNDLHENFDSENQCYYKDLRRIFQDSIPGTKAFKQDVLSQGPTIGTVLGSLFGGPLGGAVGNSVGGLASSRTNMGSQKDAYNASMQPMDFGNPLNQFQGMDPSQGSQTPNVVGINGSSSPGMAEGGPGGDVSSALEKIKQAQQFGNYSGR